MNDTVYVNNIEVYAYHGVYDEEKALGQKFYINVEIKLNKSFKQINNEIDETVDYFELINYIKDIFTRNKWDLLESAANELIFSIFHKFSNICEITLKITKPSYHVNLNFDSMCVCVNRKIHKVYISLGSNLGNRKENLDKACEILNDRNIRVLKRSKTIETKPYGNVEQDDFLNEVIEVATILNPVELMDELLEIEKLLKRERTIKWGPRTIDLDILLYDMEVVNEENVIIPHYDMHNRRFVLEPLCEINKFAYNPRLGKYAFELMEGLQRK